MENRAVEQGRTGASGWARSLAAPGVMLLGALVVLGGITWLSQRVGHESRRPDAPAFSNPVPIPGANRYIVKQASSAALSLVAESPTDPANAPVQTLTLGSGIRVEVLRPAGLSDLRPGDWLAVIGVSNSVRNFSIHSLVIIPGQTRVGTDQLARSAAGFAGNEAGANAADQVVLGGVIEQVSPGFLTINAGPTAVRIDISSRSPIYRLDKGGTAEIRDGDLVAVSGAGLADPQAALLVWPAAGR
jgi:hypothetical protein